MLSLSGVYTALVTPFTACSEGVDLERLEANITAAAGGGVTGVVPCGTTGEAPTLSDREHRAVVQSTIEAARPRGLEVIAGAGSNCTRHAVELHRFAAECGADASLQVTPYYNKPSQEGLYRHFRTIADSCALPVVLYNIPGRCGVGLEMDTIERLARHPNVVAIKEASGSLELASRIADHTDLAVLSGDDPFTLAILCLGGRGVVSVISNLLPAMCARLVQAAQGGDLAEARRLHGRLLPLAGGLLRLGPNPVPVKAALRLLGLDHGTLRLPLAPLEGEGLRRLEGLMEDAGLLGGAGAVQVAGAAEALGTRR